MLFLLKTGLIGAFTGVMQGVLGVGGGFILIPLLNLVHFPMHLAIGTSFVYVFFTTGTGVLAHASQGRIDAVLVLPLIASAVVTVQAGAAFAHILPETTLQLLFGGLTLVVCFTFLGGGQWGLLQGARPSNRPLASSLQPARFYIIPRTRTLAGKKLTFEVDLPKGVLIGGVTGFVSGMLGVGGGWLLVPLLVLVMRIPLHIAIGTSLLAILGPAAVGALTYWKSGNVDLYASLSLILSGMAAAWAGARMVSRLSERVLRQFFISLLFSAALYMLVLGFRGL